MFEFSQIIGLNETTLLYFNLISSVKEWQIKSIADHDTCMAVCRETFVNHHSRVENLSTGDKKKLNAYYYSPLACYWDCFSLELYNLFTIILTVLLLVAIAIDTNFITSTHHDCQLIMSSTAVLIYVIVACLCSSFSVILPIIESQLFLFITVIPVALLFSVLSDQQCCIMFFTMGILAAVWYIMITVLFSILSINVYLYYSLLVFPHCFHCMYSIYFMTYSWRLSVCVAMFLVFSTARLLLLVLGRACVV